MRKKRRESEISAKALKVREDSHRKREAEEANKLAELQSKLDQHISARKARIQVVDDNDIDIDNDTEWSSPAQPPLSQSSISGALTSDVKSRPSVDRTKKPSLLSSNDKCESLRKVVIPQTLVERFVSIAQLNTERNVETCAVLAGRLSHNAFTITHVLVPKQRGTSDSCLTDNEEEVFLVQDAEELMTLGWIHTHPTQSSFMSSIDLHTHCSYQLMLPEAIAIVCAPKFAQTGIYSLTDPFGIQLIANCKLLGFHPHPTDPPIYSQSPHVSFDDTIKVNLIDLR